MFKPDKWQEAALKTWYPVDNPLHLDPRHPCIKLAGEAGEILDLYGKNEYKPGFDWWECKHCHKSKNGHIGGLICYHDRKLEYTPLILDELGDYSYYLRILAYQKQATFEKLHTINKPSRQVLNEEDLLYHLIKLSEYSIEILENYYYHNEVEISQLADCIYRFLAILDKLNTPLVRVLELNRQKLHTPDAHGWKNAR